MQWVRKHAVASHVVFTPLKATAWTGWYFDGGCSRHMTGNKAHLTNIEDVKTDCVTFGGREKGKIIGKGSLNVAGLPNLKDVLLVEGLTANLISIIQVESIAGRKYVFICVDDFSKYTWVEFLKDKSETFDVFKALATQIQREKEVSIVGIRRDHGREFENSRFQEFYNVEGIKHEYSAPITPQQNGIVEMKNSTLQEMAGVMLHAKHLPIKFWPEILTNREPRQKFDMRSDEGIFLGCSRNSRALRVYNKRTQVFMDSINVKVVDQEISTTKEEDVPLAVNPSVSHNPSNEVLSVKLANDDGGIEPAARIQKNHPVENIIGEVEQGMTTRKKDIVDYRKMVGLLWETSFISKEESKDVKTDLLDEY
ncbi:hypothetical protein LIER_28135 [Lithospermum erythrorhizon]|uniref:Integrase catalytic domain-containing protein n=1 Tax=Lithospermum erythrorhizon TaxID=34254 RepID=A0AAV3RG56_LITER